MPLSARSRRRRFGALRRIRARAGTLVAIGTCAVWGGVAATSGDTPRAAWLEEIYGPIGASYDSLPARALRDVVQVDFQITGCPIEKEEFLAAVARGALQRVLAGGPVDVEGFPSIDAAAWNDVLQGRVLKEIEFTRIQGEPYYLARTVPADGTALPERERVRQEYAVAAGSVVSVLLLGSGPVGV